MSTIVTRTSKGGPLTWAEADANFDNLNTDKVETSSLATGVATALGVAVGSAGAFVTNGGALGTPSSGVGTNLTGTAAGLTAGIASAVAVGGITGLGTGVSTALAVNIGSAGGPVVFNGAIGTPSSGIATNLTGTASGLTAGGLNVVSGAAFGYGIGSGGTVTQITSKGTDVTLNKPSGNVVTHDASLAGGAVVDMKVINSTVAAADVVIVNIVSGAASASNYRVWVYETSAGYFKIVLENRTGGAISESLVINFAVIKASAT